MVAFSKALAKAGREARYLRKCRSTVPVWTILQPSGGQLPDKLEKSDGIHRSADWDSRQNWALYMSSWRPRSRAWRSPRFSASRPSMANHSYPGWRERLEQLKSHWQRRTRKGLQKGEECRNELRTPARKRKPALARKALIYPTKAELTGPKIRIPKMMTARVVANKNSVDEPLNPARPKFTIQDATGFCRTTIDRQHDYSLKLG
jgi:hypothetical protein